MRISDWSSDVCSSDLPALAGDRHIDMIRVRSGRAPGTTCLRLPQATNRCACGHDRVAMRFGERGRSGEARRTWLWAGCGTGGDERRCRRALAARCRRAAPRPWRPHLRTLADTGALRRLLHAVGRRDARDREPLFGELDQRTVRRPDRKSVVEGKSVSVRVDLGGRRIIKTKKKKQITI